MKPDEVIVSRDSVELGIFPVNDARELLHAGFLQPTDCYRCGLEAEWQPLTNLPADDPERRAGMAEIQNVAVTIGRTAGRVVGKLTVLASRGRGSIESTLGRLLEDYFPRIRETVLAASAQSADSVEAVLKDEVFLQKLFGAAYDTLPRAVQRFVNEQRFIEFCMKHRTRLLRKPE